MLKKLSIAIFIFFFIQTLLSAHGMNCDIIMSGVVSVRPGYDGNDPLSGVDVTVYSPEDLTKPYIKGKTDQNGYFYFTADIDGEWVVLVRDEGGHGVRRNIMITGEMIEAGKAQGHVSLLQKIIMGLAVVWGCIGTALFFQRRNR